MSVFTSTIANSLKETLEGIIDDPKDGLEAKAVFSKWMTVESMGDNYIDYLEMGGPGLIAEKSEGVEMSMGEITEGVLYRTYATTFAMKLVITEEAMEDGKYPEAIDLARRLKRAGWKTVDVETTYILIRGFDTNFPGGDGVPLWSASHPLPSGGTFSNLMAVPMSPSRAAVIVARAQAKKYPGHDGVTEGVMLEKVVHPVEQWGVWQGIVQSTHAPEPGNFNEINVVNKMGLELVENQYWNTTTTNYAFLTDADKGICFHWRRRFRSRTWVDNDQEMMKHGISARWGRNWYDPRCTLGVQA